MKKYVCSLCKKELPKSEFYPSNLKKRLYHCKKCIYEHYGKKAKKKYEDSIKKFDEKQFNNFYGGYTITILNYVRENEFKYIIKGTDGYFLQTNDSEEFKVKLNELVSKL